MSASAVAIAAPHRAAVAAAEESVRRGGNAVDAALAAAAALTVVYPHQCSLGGDLVALVHLPGGAVSAVLSIGAAPLDAVRPNGSRMPRQGAGSVTVPGVVAGWQALARHARLSPAEPLRHAADLARAGVAVSPGLAHAVADRRDAVSADPGLRALLLDGDEVRTMLRQPRLADTLDALAADPASFYRGEVAAKLVGFLRGGGSRLSTTDFERHEAEIAKPLVLDAPGGRWYVAPPPSQGAVLLAVLGGMAETDLVELCRRAAATRDRLLGDPRSGPVDVDGLLRAGEPAGAGTATRAAGDTVAVTAVGDDGLAVSLIQSVYQSFGAGLLDPDTGIVLHNRGSAFSLEPGHPAEFGPGRRPPHTLCPALGAAEGVLLAAGCQGGRAQPQILAQTVPELLDPGTDPAAVLARPRWVVGARDLGYERETVLAEPGSLPGAVTLPVATTEGPVDEAGHVQIARLAGTRLEAASDPRADGGAVVLAPHKEDRS
ncbi:tyramine oxidase [Amycolatopsis sp. K13G38]|uniref:Tyramine oxidase n=1 Tax=Amycolatopsis acididurans TaxID=2724524 RepID=A0ABX1IX39_9PSEU|nr:gamma-glutamyltransferase [Amycolatopsis acididurans]NKQ51339.1 tyramine oxidase [Amycolatopsis acididurans]